MALAERWQGSARDIDTFIWLEPVGTPGSALVINGKLMRGVDVCAGEIVFAPRLEFGRMSENPLAGLCSQDPAIQEGARALIWQARQGEAEALAVVDDLCAPLAELIATLAWIVAPPLIVLGGGLEDAGELLISRTRRFLENYALPPIELRMSTAGKDSAILGAVKYAMDAIQPQIFGSILE